MFVCTHALHCTRCVLINKAINKHSNLLDRCMLAERNALIEIKLYILRYAMMPVERFQFILYMNLVLGFCVRWFFRVCESIYTSRWEENAGRQLFVFGVCLTLKFPRV